MSHLRLKLFDKNFDSSKSVNTKLKKLSVENFDSSKSVNTKLKKLSVENV